MHLGLERHIFKLTFQPRPPGLPRPHHLLYLVSIHTSRHRVFHLRKPFLRPSLALLEPSYLYFKRLSRLLPREPRYIR